MLRAVALLLLLLSSAPVMAQGGGGSVTPEGVIVPGNCVKFGTTKFKVADAGVVCNFSGITGFAIPTVPVDLTTNTGVLTTALRSDARLTLNQAAAWSFSGLGNTTIAAGNWLKFGTNYAWETISTSTSLGVTSVTFTNLSAYRALRIKIFNLYAVSNSVQLWLRTSTNNGSSYDAGAGNYDSAAVVGTNAGTVFAMGGASVSDTKIVMNDAISNGAGSYVWGDINLFDFNQAANCGVEWALANRYDATHTAVWNGAGRRLDTTARNALQILFSSGNIASGFIVLEGMRGYMFIVFFAVYKKRRTKNDL